MTQGGVRETISVNKTNKAPFVQFLRLRLNGFKSFVDPTEVPIAEGLTGVVGPNGCGKSNLLEALRWVMGENRPTAMRGEGMEDVIFAGTASRSARNFAEVALTLDNSDRLAPQGFNDADLLEVVRRITRDAGSAFKANAKDVRARDVQTLFADASTGAHSPSLVRQGQIAELINAKPKARRRILEEAAGISGLYQRRHEAELKLKGAETNLARVDDVLEQLANQLAQLARQAKQAARYREISESLRKLEGELLYRRWKEADAAHAAADAALREALTGTSKTETEALEAQKARGIAELALPALRENDAAAAATVQRLKVALGSLDDEAARTEKSIEALTARAAQLAADREREAALDTDAQARIGALAEEQDNLEAAGADHQNQLDAASEEAREAASILQEADQRFDELTGDAARLAARHQSAERLLTEATQTQSRATEAAGKAKSDLAEAERSKNGAADALSQSKSAHDKAADVAKAAEGALVAADEARGDVQAREAEARAVRSEAEGEVSALQAEVAALSKLVARDGAEGGQILDVLTVEPGFEDALGAALADDLRVPEAKSGSSGWVVLPAYGRAEALPKGAESLAGRIKAPAVLERRLAHVGVVPRDMGAKLQADLRPGQRLVSKEGDLWRWDGLCALADQSDSTAALRLKQLNRIEELKQELAAATARANGAEQAHEHLKQDLAKKTELDADARDARRAADAALTEANRALSRAEAELNIVTGRHDSLTHAFARHEEEATEAAGRLKEAEEALTALGDLDAVRADVEAARETVEAARLAMLARRSFHDELRRDGEDRAKRLQAIEAERADWSHRLETAGTRIAELTDRAETTATELEAAKAAPDDIRIRRRSLDSEIDKAEAVRKDAAEALAKAENTLRDAVDAERTAERSASDARETRAGAEARAEAAREAVDATRDRIAEAMDAKPEALPKLLELDPDSKQSAERIENDVARLKRQRDAMGAVNLRAEEDAREVQEEHDTLAGEKIDLEEAIRTLRSGIASLNREGRERLLTAFEEVNTNFATLFTHLFGGGEAKLVMVESDDPLEAGLEIMCQPPGKRLATLSLLSGGEQTLTALALIFAVFLANPAPICVLDEVDAPLDDANVTRFCDLLDEMTRRTETRFMIITHHAVTMARMDRLFGVTMAEHGVSQLVSVDLQKAEAMVA